MDHHIRAAHAFCSNHQEQILKDRVCGCFYCLEIFDPALIKNWIADRKGTAVCPFCGVDAILGESSGFPITKEFLAEMKQYWF